MILGPFNLYKLAVTSRQIVCPATTPGQLFAMPTQVRCDITGHHGDLAVPAMSNIHKSNVIKYEVAGWRCGAVKKLLRLWSWFLGVEHLWEFSDEDLKAIPQECRQMINTGSTSMGHLNPQSESYTNTRKQSALLTFSGTTYFQRLISVRWFP